jgi:enamine deaminase RidA (YjgF/YER057c/UK114 family)
MKECGSLDGGGTAKRFFHVLVTDAALPQNFRGARIARFKNLKTAPANTLLMVSRLAEPEFLIEVDVIAAVPAR